MHFMVVLSVGVLAVLAGVALDFSPLDAVVQIDRLREVFAFDRDQFTDSFWHLTFAALWETLQIAYLGTFLGVFLALPFVFLASEHVSYRFVAICFRSFFALFRATPTLLWAIIFVILTGLGTTAGVLAVTCVTIGYFGKLTTDELDTIPVSKADAFVATGAGRWHIIRFVYWPMLLPKMLMTALFLFEYNIRHSTLLGIVGAGGIGFYIAGYLKWLEYDLAFALIGIIFAMVVVLEVITMQIKKHLLR